MISEAPPFWWQKPDWRAWALVPVAFVYGRIVGARMLRPQKRSVPVPVVCVGNFTVGGAGKTPTAIALARAAIGKGLKPGFLSRGYGGSLDGTHVVDPSHHRSTAVGDEALLLAREALTVISRRRFAGAKRLVEAGADLIIMDDGFQSAQLVIDYALVVIDGQRGIGNGFIVPAGPVRAPIGTQMRRLSAILSVGGGSGADALIRRASRAGKPFHQASIRPVGGGELAGRRVLAYAGIGDPAKFYRTLADLGAEVVETRSFADHQHLGEDDVAELLDHAAVHDLTLVTTAKDHVRLGGGHGRAEELAEKSYCLEIEMAFDDPQAPGLIIDQAVEAFRARRLRNQRGGSRS